MQTITTMFDSALAENTAAGWSPNVGRIIAVNGGWALEEHVPTLAGKPIWTRRGFSRIKEDMIRLARLSRLTV